MAIYQDIQITVNQGIAQPDKSLYIFKGDSNIILNFKLVTPQYTLTKDMKDVLVSRFAVDKFELRLQLEKGYDRVISGVITEDGCCRTSLTQNVIQSLRVGSYSYQITLIDDDANAIMTFPVAKCKLNILDRLSLTAEVLQPGSGLTGEAMADLSVIVDNGAALQAFDSKGNYIKTDWKAGDIIYANLLDKLENGINEVNKKAQELDSKKFDKNGILSMANMGQDVKEAMTGGSVAVVGPNSILAENIVNGQITPSKIADMEIASNNLLDVNEIVFGRYYDGNNGKIVSGASNIGLDCTFLMPCEPGVEYYRNLTSNVVMFDSSMTYIGRATGGSATTGNFSAPADSNAAYFGLSFISSNITDPNTTPYISYAEKSDSSNFDAYKVIWPELIVQQPGVIDAWLLYDTDTEISVASDGTITIHPVHDPTHAAYPPRLYFTLSYRSQQYWDLPTEDIVIQHNYMWVFNNKTEEFSLRNASTGGKWADLADNEFCLLKNTNGKVVAGLLKDYINHKLLGPVNNDTPGWGVAYSGRGIITKRDGQTVSMEFDGGYLYMQKTNHTTNSFDIADKVYEMPHNSQLIWNISENTVRVEPYSLNQYVPNNNEILLLFNYSGYIRGGVLAPYVNIEFDLKATNLLGVYDRYEDGVSVTKSDTNLTITVDQTKNSRWRVYYINQFEQIPSDSIDRLRYYSFIPEADKVVDEVTGEETILSTTTWTLPHNGMLILNVRTKEFRVELMTSQIPISYEHTGDLVLLLNIDGKFVAGHLCDVFNRRLIEQEMAAVSLSNAMYDMGKLLFKFDVDPDGSYISSESMVGDELWVFPVSNDEGTNFIKAPRYKIDFENRTATYMGSFSHNWGHVNSSSYNPWRDALICGNGSGSYELMGQIFIFENASSFKDRDQVNRNEAVIIDVQEWGYKANVVWGEANMGRGDICYVITNDAQNVRKLLLGMGSNNLGSGVMLSGKSDTQFNGTYKVLGEWTLPRIDVVQGSHYENGALYIGLGHDTAWYTKNHLHDNGSVTYKTYKETFYNADGSQLKCNMQGITVLDKYIILGLQGGGLATNQIHVYYR